jgi:hypothetical protein
MYTLYMYTLYNIHIHVIHVHVVHAHKLTEEHTLHVKITLRRTTLTCYFIVLLSCKESRRQGADQAAAQVYGRHVRHIVHLAGAEQGGEGEVNQPAQAARH